MHVWGRGREAESKEGTEGDPWKDMGLHPKYERSWASLVWVCHCLRCTLKESLCLLLRKKLPGRERWRPLNYLQP